MGCGHKHTAEVFIMSRAKLLNYDQIMDINASFDEVGATTLAKNYGVSRQTIYRARDDFQAATKGLAKATPKNPPFGEFGVTGLQRFGGTVREDYNRTWQNLLTMVPLVKEMLDHPIVGATMFAVEMYIRTAEWSVVPGGDSAKDESAKQFLEECMDDMSHTFAEHITQALSMLSYGFAPFEVCYKKRQGDKGKHVSEFDDGRIGWRKFAFRSQDTLSPGHEWEFDDNGGIKGMYQKHEWTKPEVFIPIEKMILYRTTAAKNNPQGRSALRAAYMAWYYAKNFAEIEGISAERMGGGLPVIYLGEGTSKAGSNSDFEFAKSVVNCPGDILLLGQQLPDENREPAGRGDGGNVSWPMRDFPPRSSL
jgi:DNA-binding phage protein